MRTNVSADNSNQMLSERDYVTIHVLYGFPVTPITSTKIPFAIGPSSPSDQTAKALCELFRFPSPN
jgi:hypothetical protein